MQFLKQAGLPLLDEDGVSIGVEDVVNGDKELTLALLWNIFVNLQVCLNFVVMRIFEYVVLYLHKVHRVMSSMTLTVAKCLRVSLVRIIKRAFFAFCFEKSEKS